MPKPDDFELDGREGAIYRSLARRGVKAANQADHRSIVRVCGLVADEQLPEGIVMSAAEAVLHCAPPKPIAYFFTVLHRECKQSGLFLYDMLARQKANGQPSRGVTQ